MEKLEIIIDLVEHPENYSDSQLQEILADEESMQLYEALLSTRMAVDHDTAKQVDVDMAWRKFADENVVTRGYGWRKIAAVFIGAIAMSGIAFATIHIYNKNHQQGHVAVESRGVASNAVARDTTRLVSEKPVEESGQAKPIVHKTFENVSLADMLQEIASYYGMEVVFRNAEARRLRYYYEWNSDNGIGAVIDELNHSEQVALAVSGNKIVVE